MRRRDFINAAACASGALLTRHALPASTSDKGPIIDSHIHLFDPTRQGGVPWPERSDPIYKPALPARYLRVIEGQGVVGAIAIEASPLKSDNDWLLKVAAGNPIMVGIIGDLVPDSPQFAKDLERLKADPLFLGIRSGNLWSRDLSVDIERPGFMDGLKLLAEAELVFESANPNLALLQTLVRLVSRLPTLTIVVDHLPHASAPANAAEGRLYVEVFRELGAAPNVYAKMSEIISVGHDGTRLQQSVYGDKLDAIWQAFGEDKLLYGSDWPNSDHVSSYAEGLSVLQLYLRDKGRSANARVFWRNSMRAYRWRPRLPSQAGLF